MVVGIIDADLSIVYIWKKSTRKVSYKRWVTIPSQEIPEIEGNEQIKKRVNCDPQNKKRIG